MRKFDKVLEEAGYTKPYADVDLWYKENKIYFLFNDPFDVCPYTSETATRELENGAVTIAKSVDYFPWLLPLLAGDYLHHKNHNFTEAELKYARMAMEENPKLKKEDLSSYLKDYL